MSQFNGGKAFKDKSHAGGQLMGTWHRVTELQHHVPLQALYSSSCLIPHPLAHQDPFHKQRLLLSPHLSWNHTPALLQIISEQHNPDFLEGVCTFGHERKQDGPDGTTLWTEILTDQQNRASQGNQHQDSGEEMLETQEEGQRNTARGVRRWREKHTSHPWKVQLPSCPKANCNLYQKFHI